MGNPGERELEAGPGARPPGNAVHAPGDPIDRSGDTVNPSLAAGPSSIPTGRSGSAVRPARTWSAAVDPAHAEHWSIGRGRDTAPAGARLQIKTAGYAADPAAAQSAVAWDYAAKKIELGGRLRFRQFEIGGEQRQPTSKLESLRGLGTLEAGF